MKKILIALVIWSFCSYACAGDITLAWDANSESNIAGYKIYWGTAEGAYPNVEDVGIVLTHTLTLDAGKYYITITAHDVNGNESDFSYVIITNVKIGAVKEFSSPN